MIPCSEGRVQRFMSTPDVIRGRGVDVQVIGFIPLSGISFSQEGSISNLIDILLVMSSLQGELITQLPKKPFKFLRVAIK
jgi:hypothetical protein